MNLDWKKIVLTKAATKVKPKPIIIAGASLVFVLLSSIVTLFLAHVYLDEE